MLAVLTEDEEVGYRGGRLVAAAAAVEEEEEEEEEKEEEVVAVLDASEDAKEETADAIGFFLNNFHILNDSDGDGGEDATEDDDVDDDVDATAGNTTEEGDGDLLTPPPLLLLLLLMLVLDKEEDDDDDKDDEKRVELMVDRKDEVGGGGGGGIADAMAASSALRWIKCFSARIHRVRSVAFLACRSSVLSGNTTEKHLRGSTRPAWPLRLKTAEWGLVTTSTICEMCMDLEPQSRFTPTRRTVRRWG